MVMLFHGITWGRRTVLVYFFLSSESVAVLARALLNLFIYFSRIGSDGGDVVPRNHIG